MDLVIRSARAEDLPALVAIHNHHVVHGYATFDRQPATVESRQSWFDSFTGGPYRLLVAESAQGILGSAGSRQYRAHEAFDQTVETGIYLAAQSMGRGIGTLLYTELFKQLADQPIHLAVAGVALPNDASVALHFKLGFEQVGIFRDYAVKGDRRISSAWFQRFIR